MRNYVCWDPTNVAAVAEIDAASVDHLTPQDDAVFLATHHPLAVRRVPIGRPDGGAVESSHDVLDEFRRPLRGNDPHVVLITGSVGTGKSHLIKWIHANANANEAWHQVYIEKRNTNLRRVIETILDGLTGPSIDELRDKLAIAQSAITDVNEAKSRILTELAHFVEFPTIELVSLSQEEQFLRGQLPAILRDPVLAEHLLSSDGAIDRITRLGMSGEAPEDEADLFISETDLPLDVADIIEASKPAQSAIKYLSANAKLRSQTIEILNSELSRAKATVFVGGGIDLIGVFEEVRRELATRDLELALYIEDLVLLHGIDRELAQVFTQGRGPQGELCATRIAIAVTEGYLAAGFDTLKSRAVHFSLNLRLGDEVPPSDARSFVGRYLNAIRIGAVQLNRSRTDGASEEWIPNACDACNHKAECHATFGADDNGYGLYPLNPGSTDYLVELSSEDGKRRRFDPREVIRGVIRGPLEVAAQELPRGDFPSGRFAAALDPHRARVAMEVQHRLGDDPVALRRVALLNFWRGERTQSLVNLDPGIHEAFSLPVVEDVEQALEPSGPLTGDPPKPPPPDPKDHEIEQWAQNQAVLSAKTARAVRKAVVESIVEQLRRGAHGVSVLPDEKKYWLNGVLFEEVCIRIDSASGGGTEVARPLTIRIKQSPRNAVILKAVHLRGNGSWADAGLDGYLEYRSAIDGWVDEVAAQVGKAKVESVPAIVTLAETCASAPDSRHSVGRRLEDILRCIPTSDERSRGWNRWFKEVTRARPIALRHLQQHLGEAKSTGKTSMLDVYPVLDALRKVGGARVSIDSDGESSEVYTAFDRMREARDAALEQEWSRIDSDLRIVAAMAPKSDSWPSISTAIRDAVGEAHDQGLLPVATALEDLVQRHEDVDESALDVARRLLSADRGSATGLWDLVPDPTHLLSGLASFLSYSDEVIQVLERRIADESGGATHEVSVGDVATALRTYASALDEFASGVTK